MRNFNTFSVLPVTISLISIFSYQAEASEIKTKEDYRLYCGPAAYQYNVQSPDCDRLQDLFEDKAIENESERIYKPRRRNTERENKSNNNKDGVSGYLGTTILGLYFPENESLNTGFGGSFFGGVKFNRFVGLDLELGGFFGGNEDDDAYLIWSAFLNPRFFIPLSSENKHLALYISPGIGISQLVEEYDTDDARLTWQIKGGVAIPIYKRLGGYAEIRYADQFVDEDENIDGGAFGTELGITLRL